MKFKAIFLAASIFGATLFATSTQDNNGKQDEIKKQAVDRRLIRVPAAG